MKPKVHYQAQPRQSGPPRPQDNPLRLPQFASERLREMVVRENVRQEIDTFLQALDSYPARATQDRSVSFHDHLRSICDQVQNRANKYGPNNDGRRDAPARRH